MDRLLRAEIVAEVKRSMQEAMETYEEKWVTADELCNQCQMFTRDWMRTYSSTLPRRRVVVKGMRSSRWAYALHRINRMLSEGELTVEPLTA